MRQPSLAGWVLILALLMTAPAASPCFGQNFQVNGRPASPQEYRASQLVDQGLNLLNQNQNTAACQIFAQAVQLSPGLAAAHADYGIALMKVGQNEPAISEIKYSLQIDPNQPGAWINLGALHQTQGQIDSAIQAFTEFVKRFPGNPEVPKISDLLQGLSKFNNSLHTEAGASAVAADHDGNGPDYFAEVTVQGIQRWPASAMPLKVYIKPGDDVPSYKPQFAAILKRSFDDWAAASGGKVKFVFVNDAASANVECTWTADPNQLANTAESAETRLATNSKGLIHATAIILTVPLTPGLPLTDNRLRWYFLHEIGHILGYTGHTRNAVDIMFFSSQIPDEWRDLTTRDKNTLVRLYSERSQ
ncbi:MAG TPA: tetratricopeptide repeat protein [Oculatellaceae cyanobacterium]